MKNLKLSHSLSLLVLTAIIILVSVLGIYFDTVLKKNYMENTKKRMINGFTRLYNETKQSEEMLKEGISFIKTDKYLVSSIDLVNNYQNKYEYNAALLDEEKKMIVKQLLDRVKLSLNDDIALHDKNEELIAFVQKEKGDYRLNFFSYENGNRVLYSKLESQQTYQKISYKEDLLLTFNHRSYYNLENTFEGVVTYHYSNGNLVIKSHQSLFEKDNSQITAHIEMSHIITNSYLSELSNALGIKLQMSLQSPYASSAILLNDPKSFDRLEVFDVDDSYFALVKLKTENGMVYFTAKLNTSLLLKTLYENRYQLLFILVIVTLLVLWSLHRFVSKRLTQPLNQVMGQIEKIEHSDYTPSQSVHTGDELEMISDSINQLAQTINKRERELKASQKDLEFLSLYDALTNLPNRRLFISKLEYALHKAQAQSTKLAIMFLDIDQFKQINDTLGHNVGDQLLQAVATRLNHVIRSVDTLARLGGDEFILMIENVEGSKEIETIAQKILNVFNEPFVFDEHILNTTVSIGISVYPEDGEDTVTLIKHADMAMYHSKDQGHNGYSFFSKQLATEVEKRAERINALKSAIRNGKEFHLLYQPKISISTGKIVGMEALVRWESESFGLLGPDEFIDLLEETNLIIPFGAWVTQKACSDFMSLYNEGYSIKQVSINISTIQLFNSDIVEMMDRIIKNTKIPPKMIELEITESFSADYKEQVLQTLYTLRHMGIELAIDDFGTGYSSMAYLQKLPVTRLKIDKSFVDGIPVSKESIAIVKAIVALAKTFDLNVTAEGVETEVQLRYLKDLGCDEVQGYYYAKPMDLETLKTLCAKINQ
ncbi:EAL domain-containing protein [Sulfurovum sp. zt1-1]|uniref:EAL domain-containing protein n=1 Tax=Sulfurovum zhangzhouensis TaxID=3019067 RepID=A0ABT7R023_9BACT|nr:EAL domain-containing protein [Sulfurovum zhangzhouensis]MDM5272393.1 EAL domain-containing protein [Sulfurovum zhangzhouensis]